MRFKYDLWANKHTVEGQLTVTVGTETMTVNRGSSFLSGNFTYFFLFL